MNYFIKFKNFLTNIMDKQIHVSPLRMCIGFSLKSDKDLVLIGSEQDILLAISGKPSTLICRTEINKGSFLTDCIKIHNYDFDDELLLYAYRTAPRIMNFCNARLEDGMDPSPVLTAHNDYIMALKNSDNLLLMYLGLLIEDSYNHLCEIDMLVYMSLSTFGDTNTTTSYSRSELSTQCDHYFDSLERSLMHYEEEYRLIEKELNREENTKRLAEIKEQISDIQNILNKSKDDFVESVLKSNDIHKKNENKYEEGYFASWQFNNWNYPESEPLKLSDDYAFYISDDQGIASLISGAITITKKLNGNIKKCLFCKRAFYISHKRSNVYCSEECEINYKKTQQRIKDKVRRNYPNELELHNIQSRTLRYCKQSKISKDISYNARKELLDKCNKLKNELSFSDFSSWANDVADMYRQLCQSEITYDDFNYFINTHSKSMP